MSVMMTPVCVGGKLKSYFCYRQHDKLACLNRQQALVVLAIAIIKADVVDILQARRHRSNEPD